MKQKNYFVIALFLFLSGNVLAQNEVKICKDSLPIEIKNFLNKKYLDYKITSSIKCTNKTSEIVFKVKTLKVISPQKNIIYDLSFNELGRLTDKKKSKEIFYTGYDHTVPNSSNSINNSGGHVH